jgi:predicted NUDIX family NTP pyrophosphohydrolase
MYNRDAGLKVFLAHPGGPYWRGRDRGAWTLPKGAPNPDEPFLDAALREFHEETGLIAVAPFMQLAAVRQKGGKIVHAWAFKGPLPVAPQCRSCFELEWPPHSGRRVSFPEIDQARYFSLDAALDAIAPAQAPLLRELAARLN